MTKILVVIPTYNEKENIHFIIDAVLKHEGFHVLVVDDGSPDRTADNVRSMIASGKQVSLIERSGKLGLGTAYVAGFTWGLERGYDYFIEMDADQSHDPDALPSFLSEMEKGRDLVIGSRYLNATISVVGWDFKRLILSKSGNYYASWILGLKLSDLTSGFRCYSRKALESINLEKIHSNGYAFQIEMAYRVSAAGCSVGEIPIIFYERESGISKMSKTIIREAVVLPWRLRLGRLFSPGGEKGPGEFNYNFRTIVGVIVIVSGLAEGIWLGWWLSTEGNIIDIIHDAKMALPEWAWVSLKIGLSVFAAAAFAGFLMALAITVFAGGDASGHGEMRDRKRIE